MIARGRKPVKREAAVKWLADQPWFDWKTAPDYRRDRTRWRMVADGVRAAGIFSTSTGTIDVPVERIVIAAMALRDRKVRA